MINQFICAVHRVLGTVLCLFALCVIPVRGESFVNDSLKVNGTWRHFSMFLPDYLSFLYFFFTISYELATKSFNSSASMTCTSSPIQYLGLK